jgi:hypothetical protein
MGLEPGVQQILAMAKSSVSVSVETESSAYGRKEAAYLFLVGMVVVGAVVIEDTVQRFQQFEVVCGHRGNDEVQHAREELVRAQELVVVVLEPVWLTSWNWSIFLLQLIAVNEKMCD